MLRPRTMLMVLALLAAICGGCGGSSSSTGASGSGKDTILRIGTTYYIDSLNPLLAYEPQASNAFTMIYPQLVQYGPGLKIAPDWATSWEESKDGLTWTFHLKPGGKWSDGVPLTAEDAVWWVNTIFKYQNGATSYLAGELAGLKKIAAPDPNTLVLTYKRPGALGAREPRAVLLHAQARLVEVHRQRRQGHEVVQPRAAPAGGVGRPLHDHPVPGEGHHRLQAQSVLLRAQEPRRRRRADLLHERHLDDRRPRAEPARLHRRHALHGRRLDEGQEQHHRLDRARQRGHQPRHQLEPGQAQEPRAARPTA